MWARSLTKEAALVLSEKITIDWPTDLRERVNGVRPYGEEPRFANTVYEKGTKNDPAI